MNKIKLGLTVIIFASCSRTVMDNDTEVKIEGLVACDNVTTGWTTNYDSKKATVRTLNITIHEPKNIDVENETEVDSLSLRIVSNVFDELEKIDTTVNNVQLTFLSGKKESTMDFQIDELLATLGMHYFKEGKHEKGISYLTQAIKIQPNIPKHYNNRASQFYELKQFDKALPDVIKAYELDPGNPERLRTIAVCYLEMNDLDETKEIIEKTIKMDPEYSSAYAVRARVFRRTNKLDSAILDFTRAISLDSTVSKWRKELSEIYLDNNDLKDALSTIEVYLKREDDDGQGYLLKGRIFLKMKNRKDACENFLLANKLGESNSEPYIRKECKSQ